MSVKRVYVDEHLLYSVYWVSVSTMCRVTLVLLLKFSLHLTFSLMIKSTYTVLSGAYGCFGILKMSKAFSKGSQHGTW